MKKKKMLKKLNSTIECIENLNSSVEQRISKESFGKYLDYERITKYLAQAEHYLLMVKVRL